MMANANKMLEGPLANIVSMMRGMHEKRDSVLGFAYALQHYRR